MLRIRLKADTVCCGVTHARSLQASASVDFSWYRFIAPDVLEQTSNLLQHPQVILSVRAVSLAVQVELRNKILTKHSIIVIYEI
jgi:hypothetical protein